MPLETTQEIIITKIQIGLKVIFTISNFNVAAANSMSSRYLIVVRFWALLLVDLHQEVIIFVSPLLIKPYKEQSRIELEQLREENA